MSLNIEREKNLTQKKKTVVAEFISFLLTLKRTLSVVFVHFELAFLQCRFYLKLTHFAFFTVSFLLLLSLLCPLLAATVRRSLGGRGRRGLRFWASCSSEYSVTRTSTKPWFGSTLLYN